MKKIILSLSALFAVSIASAQSYTSQPDPSTYEVRHYKATKKVQPATAQPDAAQPDAKPANGAAKTTNTFEGNSATAQTAATAQPAVVSNDKKVAGNKKK